MHNFETLKTAGAPVDWLPPAPSYANIHPVGISARARIQTRQSYLSILLSLNGARTYFALSGVSRIGLTRHLIRPIYSKELHQRLPHLKSTRTSIATSSSFKRFSAKSKECLTFPLLSWIKLKK